MSDPTPKSSDPAGLQSVIVLNCDRSRKSAYIRAAAGEKLAPWCFRHLDQAADYDPAAPPRPPPRPTT